MSQYNDFMKQYAKDNNLSYHEARSRGKNSYHLWKIKQQQLKLNKQRSKVIKIEFGSFWLTF
jgi:hypothetical protein